MAVIQKSDSILMRKKPEGSFPYEETWYLFGCERDPMKEDSETLDEYIYNILGLHTQYFEKISTDEEIKEDHDGITKKFLYSDFICQYRSGEPIAPEGAEKVEWVPKDRLSEYDIVPPAVKFFKKIGYL